MRYRSMLAVAAVTALAAATTVVTATTSSAVDTTSVTVNQSSQPAGSFALSGPAAAHYKLPSGMRELHTATFPDGRTQTRYQQVVDGASVFGGQITIIRSAAGEAETVIGAHFPALQAKNKATADQGRGQAEGRQARSAPRATSTAPCASTPQTGRLFYQVQSIRSDAASGALGRRDHRRDHQGVRRRHRGRGHRRQGRHQDRRHHADAPPATTGCCPATTARRPTTR